MATVARFAPLGIATNIIAEDPGLLNSAVAGFACFRAPSGNSVAKVVIRLSWTDLATPAVGFGITVKGSWLRVRGGGVDGWADSSTGEAACAFSSAVGSDSAMVAETTETLLLFLLSRSGRIPVHAASISIGGQAIVLAGRSGSGKSSLALAAQRAGLAVLSEDTSYVELEPELRIWGWPGAIHVEPANAPKGEFAMRLRNGRLKAAVPRAPEKVAADTPVLVAIARGTSLDLQPIEPARLLNMLSPTEAGFELLRGQIETALAALAERGAWRLVLGRDPAEAIDLLCRRFGRASGNVNATAV